MSGCLSVICLLTFAADSCIRFRFSKCWCNIRKFLAILFHNLLTCFQKNSEVFKLVKSIDSAWNNDIQLSKNARNSKSRTLFLTRKAYFTFTKSTLGESPTNSASHLSATDAWSPAIFFLLLWNQSTSEYVRCGMAWSRTQNSIALQLNQNWIRWQYNRCIGCWTWNRWNGWIILIRTDAGEAVDPFKYPKYRDPLRTR